MARRFPAVLAALEDGSVTLTNVRRLAPHLTAANHQSVLALARHKGKREVEELVAGPGASSLCGGDIAARDARDSVRL